MDEPYARQMEKYSRRGWRMHEVLWREKEGRRQALQWRRRVGDYHTWVSPFSTSGISYDHSPDYVICYSSLIRSKLASARKSRSLLPSVGIWRPNTQVNMPLNVFLLYRVQSVYDCPPQDLLSVRVRFYQITILKCACFTTGPSDKMELTNYNVFYSLVPPVFNSTDSQVSSTTKRWGAEDLGGQGRWQKTSMNMSWSDELCAER